MANETQNKDNARQLQQAIQKHTIEIGNQILKFSEERLANKSHDKIEKAKLFAFKGERLEQDLSLRRLYDLVRGSGYELQMGKAFFDPYKKYVKSLYEKYYEAIKKEDDEEKDKAFASLKVLKQEIDQIKEEKTEYGDNMFGGPGGKPKLSKGNSTQQISIADQIYTQNPELKIFFGEKEHVERGVLDFYGQVIKVNEQYGIVEDFANKQVFVNMKEGNKGLFVPPLEKALEYQELRKQKADEAREASANQETPDLDVGGIQYQIDKLFLEKETVLSFCHDDILEDGSTFKQHLYNHRDLTKIKYADFELEDFDENRDGFIDNIDREKVVDALTNPDSQFFDIEVLRELVTEYFTKKIYNAWGKNLGFDDNWLRDLEINRLKSNMDRFEQALKEAKILKQATFMFDGESYKTTPNSKVDQPYEQKLQREDVDYVKKYNLDK